MGHRPFSELRAKMSPEARQRSRAMAHEMLKEMELRELRETLKVTQVDLATKLKTTQAAISRLEKRPNVLVGSLNQYIYALGGRLELRAVLPDRTVVLTNVFRDMTSGELRIAAKTKTPEQKAPIRRNARQRKVVHA